MTDAGKEILWCRHFPSALSIEFFLGGGKILVTSLERGLKFEQQNNEICLQTCSPLCERRWTGSVGRGCEDMQQHEDQHAGDDVSDVVPQAVRQPVRQVGNTADQLDCLRPCCSLPATPTSLVMRSNHCKKILLLTREHVHNDSQQQLATDFTAL